jgi:hypothetical protein
VHLVSTLEEMPVQETFDAAQELQGLGLHLGHVIVSMPSAAHLDASSLEALASGTVNSEQVAESLRRTRPPRSFAVDAISSGLIDEGRDHAQRMEIERGQRARLHDLALPMIDSPLLPDGVDPATLQVLAEAFSAQLDALHGPRVRPVVEP